MSGISAATAVEEKAAATQKQTGFRLESESRAYVFQTFRDLVGRSLQLLGNRLLLIRVQIRELLAQIAVYYGFNWIVERPVGRVVSAAQRRVFGAHVHLEMLKEVFVFRRTERHHHANGARQGRVNERIAAARYKRGFLQRRDRFSQIERGQQFDFLRCTVQQAAIPKTFVTSRIGVYFVRRACRQPILNKSSSYK